jgi:epoxyqueuosine reductase
MDTKMKALLAEEKIEYCGILPFTECKVINPALLQRACADWEPRSALIMAIPYYTGEYERRNVSLYAVAKDYHLYFRGLYARLEEKLAELFPNYHFKGFADHSPIGETGAAAKAGLGVIGDKFQLITHDYGSHVFLGEILTDAIFDEYDTTEVRFCSHCGACQKACPVENGCLSEMTQRKGELDEETKRLIGQTGIAWGCDLCRTSCPMNRNVKDTPIDFFRENLTPVITSDDIQTMTKSEFQERAYSWRGRNTILRNIKILEENSQKPLLKSIP